MENNNSDTSKKKNENLSMREVLKQVYNIHSLKVKDLEFQITTLKQELETARGLGCMKCKELQAAYDVCKAEYRTTVMAQSRRLDNFDKLFSSVNAQQIKSMVVEQHQETQTLEEFNSLTLNTECLVPIEQQKVNSKNIIQTFKADSTQLANTGIIQNPAKVIKEQATNLLPASDPSVEVLSEQEKNAGFAKRDVHAKSPPVINGLVKKALPASNVSDKASRKQDNKLNLLKSDVSTKTKVELSAFDDDLILVPSTLDITYTPPVRTSTQIDTKLKLPEKPILTRKMSDPNQENLIYTKGSADKCIINAVEVKRTNKRALSDLTSNAMTQNKRRSPEVNSTNSGRSAKDENSVGKAASRDTIVIEQLSLRNEYSQSKNPGSWAENFKDFNCDDLTKENSPSIINFKAPFPKSQIISLSDDDFVENNSNNEQPNGDWKTCNKKNKPKKDKALLKSIKSTSRFKLTLEAPSTDYKKTNYKQTKLSKGSFKPNEMTSNEITKTVSANNANAKERTLKSSVHTSEGSTALGLSDLASLTDFDETFVPDVFNNRHIASINENSSNVTADKPKSTAVKKDSSSERKKVVRNNKVGGEMNSDLEDEAVCSDEDGKAVASNSKSNPSEPCDSFDRVPISAENVNYKYKEDPVRSKSERKKLDGFNCKECEKYYSDLELPDDEKKNRLKQCSRHRAKHAPPSTPDHFWELTFPDTAECKARGYVTETQVVQLQPRRRRQLE